MDQLNINCSIKELVEYFRKVQQASSDVRQLYRTLELLLEFIEQRTQPVIREQEPMASLLSELLQQAIHQDIEQLTYALQQCDLTRLALLKQNLTRMEFYNALESTIRLLNDDEIRLVMVWSANWMQQVSEQLQKVSPDINQPDFVRAEINRYDYEAMQAIDRILNG